MNEFLLIFETILFLAGSILLFRQQKMFGIYFFVLWVYIIFSQIGYFFFPELSLALFAYFGEGVGREATYFVILSALTLLLYLRFAGGAIVRAGRRLMSLFEVEQKQDSKLERRALGLVVFSLALQLLLFVTTYADISWINAQQEDVFRTHPALGVLILLIQLSIGVNIALYCHLRERPLRDWPKWRIALVFTAIGLFLLFTFKFGNREDNVALFLGIAIFELNRVRLRLKHLGVLTVTVMCTVAYLNVLEATRTESSSVDKDLAAAILVKDYYPPSHILFAAIALHEIHPLTVIESNIANSLMFLGQPYLQAPIMANFFPGGATRGASYGFYPLTEGYMFAGFAGFLYNGVVLGSLLAGWCALATTNSRRLNNFLIAIVGSMSINLVRGQTSYYIKTLYIYILPSTLVYLAISGQKIRAHFRIELTVPAAQDGRS